MSPHRCRKRPTEKSSRSVALFTMASLLSHNSATAFVAPHSTASTQMSFRTYFQNSNVLNLPFTTSQQQMPIWLSRPQGHLLKEHVQILSNKLSYLSHDEQDAVMRALQEASAGNDNQMAGACSFLLILAGTMEMGATALMAAAHHYCSCVTARQQGTYPLLLLQDESLRQVAENAATLKRMEMVASKVTVHSSSAENLKKLLLSETNDWRALAIRCAASLYRLQGIVANHHKGTLTPEIVRASREALHIYAPLASRLGMHRLKSELETTAFSILYKRQYETVTSLAKQLQKRRDYNIAGLASIESSMRKVLTAAKNEITDMLQRDAVFFQATDRVEVTARVKEPYSLWRKMLKQQKDHILQVPDALALRIVLKSASEESIEVTRSKEVALCYYAQELCMRKWPPAADPRIKDYIANPKPNGYQSLHYTASTHWGGHDYSLEIQCRSWEMHSVAEYGLASHWDYKSKQQPQQCLQQDDAYLEHRQLLQRPQQHDQASDPYISALSKAKLDLERQSVIVVLQGKVLALPSGSCVLDALREGERQFGFSSNREAAVNDQAASITTRLQNGDVLTTTTTAAAVL